MLLAPTLQINKFFFLIFRICFYLEILAPNSKLKLENFLRIRSFGSINKLFFSVLHSKFWVLMWGTFPINLNKKNICSKTKHAWKLLKILNLKYILKLSLELWNLRMFYQKLNTISNELRNLIFFKLSNLDFDFLKYFLNSKFMPTFLSFHTRFIHVFFFF